MQNYSAIQKFLHDFVLKKKIINKSLFELEKIFYLKNKEIKNQSHIFITGMPRSGTTCLLNLLFSSEQFASLTYNNMPFILSPNFSKLSIPESSWIFSLLTVEANSSSAVCLNSSAGKRN